MPERKPNQIARVTAVVALVVAFVLVAFTIATSGNDSGGKGNGGGSTTSEPTQQGERALERGFYVVKEGDTIAQIAADTGLDQDQVIELNPSLDPQALSPGQRVRLSVTP